MFCTPEGEERNKRQAWFTEKLMDDSRRETSKSTQVNAVDTPRVVNV